MSESDARANARYWMYARASDCDDRGDREGLIMYGLLWMSLLEEGNREDMATLINSALLNPQMHDLVRDSIAQGIRDAMYG